MVRKSPTPKWMTPAQKEKYREQKMFERRWQARHLRESQKDPKTHRHTVWLKVPLNEMEVYGRYKTRRAADKIARALERKYAGGNYGPGQAWVESPGSIEAKLRKMSEEYEE